MCDEHITFKLIKHLKQVNKLTTVCNLKVLNTWQFFVLQFDPSSPEVLLVRTAKGSKPDIAG